MKKTVLAIAMTAMIVFAGAEAMAANASFAPAKAKAQAAETVKQVDTNQAAPEEEDSFHVDARIVTPYYSITIPAEWVGACTIRTVNNNTGMWLKLFRKDKAGFEGHLFSILLTDDEKYEIIADHRLLGELQDVSGHAYHVVAVFPTDVQFSREDKENYSAMFAQAETILGSIEAADGCTYSKTE